MSDVSHLPIKLLKSIKELKDAFNSDEIYGYKLILEFEKFNLVISSPKSSFYFKIVNYDVLGSKIEIKLEMTPSSETNNNKKEESVDSEYLRMTYHSWKELIRKYEIFTNYFKEELIIKDTNTLPLNTPNLLSYCLKQIQIQNYFAVKYAEIIDIPENTQWVFLIGENGFGKTLILQSLFIGLFGNVDDDKILAKDQEYEILVEYNEGLNNRKVSRIKNIIDTITSEKLRNLVAIGASRLNLANESASEVTEKSTASYSLFKTDGLLLNIDKELVNLSLKGEAKFDVIRNGLIQLLEPYLQDVVYDSKNDVILYYEKDEENEKYKAVKYDSLASGFKSIIGMAGDIIIRLSKHQEINELTDLEGIVLIDEFDLHLHPKFQIEAVKAFTKVFPKIQFIVSTHSPMPLLGAPLTSQVYKVCRNKEHGVYVEKIEVDLKKLTPNLILTSPIFDLDSISNVNASLDDVSTEDDYDELIKNEAIDEFLSNKENIKKKYPDSIFS